MRNKNYYFVSILFLYLFSILFYFCLVLSNYIAMNTSMHYPGLNQNPH